MTPQPKSAYRLICERECEWCAKNFPRFLNKQGEDAMFHTSLYPSSEPEGSEILEHPACTAPSMEAVIERQEKEIEELRKALDKYDATALLLDRKRLNWLDSQHEIDTQRGALILRDGVERQGNMSRLYLWLDDTQEVLHEGKNLREAIDAAIDAAKEKA